MKYFIIITICLLYFESIGRAQSTFSPYISQKPIIEEMSRIGIERQRIYDYRKDWIQNRITGLINLLAFLFNDKDLSGFAVRKIQDHFRAQITEYVNTIGAIDFADNYQFSLIQNKFDDFESFFYKQQKNALDSHAQQIDQAQKKYSQPQPEKSYSQSEKTTQPALENPTNYKFLTSFISSSSGVDLFDTPDFAPRILYTSHSNSIVYVINNEFKDYAKISVDGHVGWVQKIHLNRKE